ncbi:hypothetical protein FSOLCH5_007239 [Fusarium solani]
MYPACPPSLQLPHKTSFVLSPPPLDIRLDQLLTPDYALSFFTTFSLAFVFASPFSSSRACLPARLIHAPPRLGLAADPTSRANQPFDASFSSPQCAVVDVCNSEPAWLEAARVPAGGSECKLGGLPSPPTLTRDLQDGCNRTSAASQVYPKANGAQEI